MVVRSLWPNGKSLSFDYINSTLTNGSPRSSIERTKFRSFGIDFTFRTYATGLHNLSHIKI